MRKSSTWRKMSISGFEQRARGEMEDGERGRSPPSSGDLPVPVPSWLSTGAGQTPQTAVWSQEKFRTVYLFMHRRMGTVFRPTRLPTPTGTPAAQSRESRMQKRREETRGKDTEHNTERAMDLGTRVVRGVSVFVAVCLCADFCRPVTSAQFALAPQRVIRFLRSCLFSRSPLVSLSCVFPIPSPVLRRLF